MSYAEQAHTPKTQSLIQDTSNIATRLQEIYEKVRRLGDQLHGSEPRDAIGSPTEKVEPMPTMRRNIDKLNAWVGQLENELSRIDARL